MNRFLFLVVTGALGCGLVFGLSGAADDKPPARDPGAQPPPAKAPFDAKEAKKLQQSWAKYLGRKVEESLELGDGQSLELVLIPPGTFMMGVPDDEKGAVLEQRRHQVTITQPFYLGKYLVTQAQYRQAMGENPSQFSAQGDYKDRVAGMETGRFPVETVSWEEAVAFCKKVSKGKKVELPTEAEWEYACRAGTTTPFSFGKELNGKQANCDGSREPYGTSEKGPSLARPSRVGSYAANAFGLYDMHGNLWQWCADWYGAKYYQGCPEKDPRGPETGENRVLRGGSWGDVPIYCRSCFRYELVPTLRDSYRGFRVAIRLE